MAGLTTALSLLLGLVVVLTGAWLVPNGVTVSLVPTAQGLHVISGALALIPTTVALIAHWRIRGLQGLGLAAAVALAAAFGTGLALTCLALLGHTPPGWLLPSHLWTSVLSVLAVFVHVGAVAHAQPRLRRVRRWLLPAVAGTALVGASVGAATRWARPGSPLPPGYSMPFGDAPFAPSNMTLAGTPGVVHGSTFAGSLACRSCHAEIYEQWSESMHRYAGTDPHVAVGIRWFQRDNGAESGRFCAGCHNPIALLAGGVDPATSPPDVGTRPHDEGISCLVCHSVDRIHEPVANAGLALIPPDVPPFGPGPLYDAAIRMDIGRHKAAMRRPNLADVTLCGACHAQFTPEALTGPGPSGVHGQYIEWLEGPYASGPEKKTCNDCHMPLVPSQDPAAIGGKVHNHRFAAANVAHALASGHENQAAEALTFLRSGLDFAVQVAPVQDRPDALVLTVSLTNRAVGHRFPTGTTDISETWFEVVAGPPEKPLLHSGFLDEAHYLDEKAHVYKTVYVDDGNVPVDLHNLARVRKVTLDTFVAPKQTDSARYEVLLGGLRTGTVPVVARLRMRKANQRWNDWLSNFDGSTVTVTDIFETTLLVDLATVTLPDGGAPAVEAPLSSRAGPADAPPVPGMVYVPSGPARIGADDGDADERPVHVVDLEGFYLDRAPVTNAQYRQFVVANGRAGPVHRLDWAGAYNWTGQEFPAGTGARPAVLIRWEDARDYCEWAGKRLPREAEWEKAARGPDGRRYPWGDRWEDGACALLDGVEVPDRTGLCPDRASPYGALDMVGGVFEWVFDTYQAYDRTHLHPNANEWINSFGDPSYVLRGTPAGQVGPATTASARSGHADNMRAKIGFRCAKSRPGDPR